MSLTTFVDGTTVVTAAFLNSIFNTGGGHVHDGASDDGSASKIDPIDHVDWDSANLAVTDDSETDGAEGRDYWVLDISANATKVGLGDLGGVRTDRVYLDTLRPNSGSTIWTEGMSFLDGKVRTSGGFLRITDTGGATDEDLHCAAIQASGAVTATGNVSGANIGTAGTVTAVDGTFSGDVDCAIATATTRVDTNEIRCYSGTEVAVKVSAGVYADVRCDDVFCQDITATGVVVADPVPVGVVKITDNGAGTVAIAKNYNSKASAVGGGSAGTTGQYDITVSAVSATGIPVQVTVNDGTGTAILAKAYFSTTTNLRVLTYNDSGAAVNVAGLTVTFWDF